MERGLIEVKVDREKHPDAEGNNADYVRSIQNVRSALLANLPIEVARKVAYGNAKELFGLK